MAYGPKAYLFGADGTSWTVIENGAATAGSIPLPSGVSAMTAVATEMAPSGRPLVTFTSGKKRYAAFFDGSAFVKTTEIADATEAHADAQERVYYVTSNALFERTPGSAAIARGNLPTSERKAWTAAANGTVYVLSHVKRPSTIHPGDQADDLRSTRLLRGATAWTDDVLVGSNEGWGFGTIGFAAAGDGSLHVAYVPIGIYFRSRDGLSWASEGFHSATAKATMIDPTTPGIDGVDPAYVQGNIRLVAAQDFDHASITLAYNGGSFSRPSYYFLRRCGALTPPNTAWPAERLILSSGKAFAPTPVAVNQQGMPTLLTFYGVRQDVP